MIDLAQVVEPGIDTVQISSMVKHQIAAIAEMAH